uniref:hypothetical protein n=1 Tax=Dendronalium phyllosphericum TaxID=2840445 RepID=UPI001CEC3699|nr:hypothetical protein [Dendronalium phyllosphericum]
MTAILSGYQLLETLHYGEKTVIYRGRRETDNASVIIKTLLEEHPPLEDIARLRHEYQIIEPLQIPGIVKPYELKNYQHSLALVLEDIPGCLLKEAIATQTTSLITFVQVAISAIILKLLAKTAEERYQSAWGLKADLEECLFQLQATGKIENFVPGRRDRSGHFLIPHR